MGEGFTLLSLPVFAICLVQGVDFQVVAVKVKVKEGFAFTLN